MGILIYVLIVFSSTLVLLLVEGLTGMHLAWIEGVILSFPAFLMICRTIWGLCLGRKAEGTATAVTARGGYIVNVHYTDAAGNTHVAETRAVYGMIKSTYPPDHVMIRYFLKYPKRILIGWRGFLYWFPIDLTWITFTAFIWYACTMY